MRKSRTYISFDWAMKKLLRQKANFDVLEGFLSTLLRFDVKIQSILESESNPETNLDKNNKLDILCEDEKKQLIFVEVQFHHQIDFFQRILFGASKLLSNYMEKGKAYKTLRKVYSINILYFDLGQGLDYVYHGKTEFKGFHRGDILSLSGAQRNYFGYEDVFKIYPEYYILRINSFNDIAKSSLDQWIYFLKNSELPKNYSAAGLKEAGDKLKYQKMSKAEQVKYDKYLETFVVSESEINTARYEGKLEGREEGREENKIDVVVKAYREGSPISFIAKITGSSEKWVEQVLAERGLTDK
ncbi:MAG: Rpn family recombination-promoting nuclease/putative transposase [Bacteroidetes bacterium]|jgi:predicted transposase/invertase (TIGR01784 family)|nr:Rpn family recombination-promoting nuclease/putative transposase [Bacteroidota bacterium]